MSTLCPADKSSGLACALHFQWEAEAYIVVRCVCLQCALCVSRVSYTPCVKRNVLALCARFACLVPIPRIRCVCACARVRACSWSLSLWLTVFSRYTPGLSGDGGDSPRGVRLGECGGYRGCVVCPPWRHGDPIPRPTFSSSSDSDAEAASVSTARTGTTVTPLPHVLVKCPGRSLQLTRRSCGEPSGRQCPSAHPTGTPTQTRPPSPAPVLTPHPCWVQSRPLRSIYPCHPIESLKVISGSIRVTPMENPRDDSAPRPPPPVHYTSPAYCLSASHSSRTASRPV